MDIRFLGSLFSNCEKDREKDKDSSGGNNKKQGATDVVQ